MKVLMRDRCSDNNDTELHREIVLNQYTGFKREVESESDLLNPCGSSLPTGQESSRKVGSKNS